MCTCKKTLPTEKFSKARQPFSNFQKSRIAHYHEDNGIFANNAFLDIKSEGKTIACCGVTAHHPNVRAEKQIRDLQERKRFMLLDAIHQWPDAITPHLWLYMLKDGHQNKKNHSQNTGWAGTNCTTFQNHPDTIDRPLSPVRSPNVIAKLKVSAKKKIGDLEQRAR